MFSFISNFLFKNALKGTLGSPSDLPSLLRWVSPLLQSDSAIKPSFDLSGPAPCLEWTSPDRKSPTLFPLLSCPLLRCRSSLLLPDSHHHLFLLTFRTCSWLRLDLPRHGGPPWVKRHLILGSHFAIHSAEVSVPSVPTWFLQLPHPWIFLGLLLA